MRKIIILISVIIFSISSFAQKTKVEESTAKIAGNKNNCLVVWIKGANKKDVENEWLKLMKNTNAKISSKKEIFADDALIPSLSANTIDVYATIEQKDNDVKLVVAFDLGGAFLNSKDHISQYKVAEKMIYDFAIEISKLNIKNQIVVENKKINKLKKNKSKIEKNIEKKKSENQKLKTKISDNEKLIKDNENLIKSLDKDIKDQENLIIEIGKKFKAID